MADKKEVQLFLDGLHAKIGVFGVAFENRDKNIQALLDLEITGSERIEYIKKLKVENYFAGPKKDTNDPSRPDYWEFGMMIKGKEVYIKINMGHASKRVICISFHIAEREIHYCFKKEERG